MNCSLPTPAAVVPAHLPVRQPASAQLYPTTNPLPTQPPAPEVASGARLVRAQIGERLFPGFPPRLNHVVVLSDLTPASGPALEFALELAAHFQARLTLMHGGEALPSLPASASDERDCARLLCLFWQAQRRHPDASVCLGLNRRPEQALAAAAERRADLVVLPQSILKGFSHLIIRAGSSDWLQGSPCPAVVVDAGLAGSMPSSRSP